MKANLCATSLVILAWTRFCQCESTVDSVIRRRAQQVEQHFPFQSRIVGGTAAEAGSFQYSVYIGGCGGSLIWDDIVLTAAHCQPLYPDRVRIGGSMKTNGELRDVVGVGTSHPLYNNKEQDYDFMVYKLASPVTSMKPVVLNNEYSNPSVGDPLTVIGFGSTFEGDDGSDFLQKVEVRQIAQSSCNFAYFGQVREDIMFCAGGEGKDSCQGDSGGPIVDANGIQVGVTSWGNGCARQGYPGVYARVSAAYDWLQGQICAMSDYPPATCGNGNTAGSSSGNIDSASNNITSDGSSNSGSNVDLVQLKGISLRVDINYDEYPTENAWVLYNDDTKAELHWSNYGDVETPGLRSKTFADLIPGNYVFLMLDQAWDGICCRYGNGYVKVYEVFPSETGREEELLWSNDGTFLNAAGAEFSVTDDGSRRLLGHREVNINYLKNSAYVPYVQK